MTNHFPEQSARDLNIPIFANSTLIMFETVCRQITQNWCRRDVVIRVRVARNVGNLDVCVGVKSLSLPSLQSVSEV